MDGYVSKPIRAADLFAEIEKHVPIASGTAAQHPPAASGEPGRSGVLDRAALFERIDGDRDLLVEIVGAFLKDCPRLVAAIREAVAQGDAKTLERTAHALKGSVSNFAAQAATAAAERLEQMGREGNLSQATEGYALLEQEMERLQSLLAELVQEVAC